jgi:hypothetical protein
MRLQDELGFALPAKLEACEFAEGLGQPLGVKEFVEIKIHLVFV